MVSSKNCDGEAQMEDPFPTALSARMLIPEEEMCPPERERQRERERETERDRERETETQKHTHTERETEMNR